MYFASSPSQRGRKRCVMASNFTSSLVPSLFTTYIWAMEDAAAMAKGCWGPKRLRRQVAQVVMSFFMPTNLNSLEMLPPLTLFFLQKKWVNFLPIPLSIFPLDEACQFQTIRQPHDEVSRKDGLRGRHVVKLSKLLLGRDVPFRNHLSNARRGNTYSTRVIRASIL